MLQQALESLRCDKNNQVFGSETHAALRLMFPTQIMLEILVFSMQIKDLCLNLSMAVFASMRINDVL